MLQNYRLIINFPYYNTIRYSYIYIHSFITNFKFISKLEQGGKKKFEKKKQNFK